MTLVTEGPKTAVIAIASSRDPARLGEFDAYYEKHLPALTRVPAVWSGQRFKALSPTASPYLAVYGVESIEVFSSEAYRAFAGPQSSTTFHTVLREWRRNLYAGIDRAPEVLAFELLITVDDIALRGTELPGPVTWLSAVGFDKRPAQRGISVIACADRGKWQRFEPAVIAFEPISGYVRAPN